MKKKIMIITIVIMLIICSLLFIKYNSESHEEDVYIAKIEKNFYKVVNNSEFSIFDNQYQEIIDQEIEKLLKKKYKFNNPLMILNPYGTNISGVNIYFNTDEALEISYTASVDNEKIPEFSQVLKNDNEDNFTKEHKYQLIGLIPGEINYINLVGKSKNDEKIETNLIIDMTSVECEEEILLETINGKSMEKLSDGLFVNFDLDNTIDVYDNNGVLRADLYVDAPESKKIMFYKGDLYYRYDDSIIGVIDRLGRIKAKYLLEGYDIHHDYIIDENNEKIIALTSSYEESEMRIYDIVTIVDMKTGEIESNIDMLDFLPELYKKVREFYKEQNYFIVYGAPWVHLNSISLVDGKPDIIVSSRETSSIMYIQNIYENPSIKYIITDEEVFKNTEYEDLVLNKIGNFVNQASQHCVEYIKDSSLKKGQYYLIMFNNNFGENYTTKDFPWHKYPGAGALLNGEKSMYYKYLVDENEGTYKLVDKIDVEYSAERSSVQVLDNNIIICSADIDVYGEYDGNGGLIRKFYGDDSTYRVFKYDFKDIWFK